MTNTSTNIQRNTDLVQFSEFRNARDKHPSLVECSKSDFFELFSTHDVRVAKDGPAFSPAVYEEGKTRANHNVISLNLIVLDVDDGDKDAVLEACEAQGLQYIVYSTHSYRQNHQCFRVITFPSRPILCTEWERVWAATAQVLRADVDPNTCDVSRIYYAASCSPEGKNEAFVMANEEGKCMDVDALLAVRGSTAAPMDKRSKKGSASSLKKAREIAEDILHKHFSGQLWFFHENFRKYHQGYWRQLDVKVDVMKVILMEYPELGAQEVKEVTETLKLLTVGRMNESSRDGAERGRKAPELICLSNGTLNPATGELLPHSPSHRLLSRLRLAWARDAKAEQFMQYLVDVWGHEPDFEQRVSFLQEFMGYILYPSNKFERFLWLVGAGANGKSVLLRIMAELAGEENTSRLHLDRLGQANVRPSLEGKMLNISSEMNSGATLADGYVKSITSGETMEAEPKYKDSYSFDPTVKLVAATNALPRLKDTSGGFARRAVILSFTRVFGEDERDADLIEKLLVELPGILAWAVEGLQRLLKRGKFVPPPSSEETLITYRTESDSVAMFNHECLLPCETGTAVGTLYEAYRAFCQTNGFQPTNSAVFGRRLTDLGIAGLGKKASGKPFRAARLSNGSGDVSGNIGGEQGPDDHIVPTAAPKRTKVSLAEMLGDIDEVASNDSSQDAAA